MTQWRTPSAGDRDGAGLALDLDSVGRATWRAELRSVLGTTADPATLEDVMLVTGELVANALEHGVSPASLEVLIDDTGGVLVSVLDHGPVLQLTPVPIALHAARGRGLVIVASLTSEWGVSATDHGKAVWGRVAPQDEARR